MPGCQLPVFLFCRDSIWVTLRISSKKLVQPHFQKQNKEQGVVQPTSHKHGVTILKSKDYFIPAHWPYIWTSVWSWKWGLLSLFLKLDKFIFYTPGHMDPVIHSKKLHLFPQFGHGGEIQIKDRCPERRHFVITDHREVGLETGFL